MKMVVYTVGTFDLLHVGHLALLEYCRTLGDVFAVGVASDSVVNAYKPNVPPFLDDDEAQAADADNSADEDAAKAPDSSEATFNVPVAYLAAMMAKLEALEDRVAELESGNTPQLEALEGSVAALESGKAPHTSRLFGPGARPGNRPGTEKPALPMSIETSISNLLDSANIGYLTY